MRPDPKVTAGFSAGAFVTILVWLLQEVAEVQVPAEVAAAATTLFGGLAAYFMPNKTPPPSTPDQIVTFG